MHRQVILLVSRKDRASALVAVIIFGAILSICAAFAYRSTIYQTRMAARSHAYLSALNVAEAGAELAMLELNKTTNAFSGWTGSDPVKLTQIISNDQGEQMGEVVVQVSDLGSNPRVTSTGYVPNKANSTLARTVQLNTKSNTAPAPWGEFGLFAFGDIKVTGDIPMNSFGNDDPTVATNKANIAAMGNMSLKGLKINGNVQAQGDVSIDWGTKISGAILYGGTFTKPKELKTVEAPKKSSLRRPEINELPKAPKNPGYGFNNNAISMYNQDHGTTSKGVPDGAELKPHDTDITIPAPGNYHFKKLAPTGPSTITVVGTGDVNIYVDNALDLSQMANITFENPGTKNGPNVTIVTKQFIPSGWGGNTGFIYVNDGAQLSMFADEITFSHSTKVQLNDGSIAKFIAKDLTFAGGAAINMKNGKPGKPGDLILYASESAKLGAGAKVSAVYYGPNVDTTFSGGMDWWGAVIGNNITISGGPGLRIDEGLFTPTGGSGAVVTAWTETSPKRI